MKKRRKEFCKKIGRAENEEEAARPAVEPYPEPGEGTGQRYGDESENGKTAGGKKFGCAWRRT